jgi:hypothetical protein
MNFQYIVIIVAIIIYLVVAGFIGYGIYKSQNSIQWPPFSSSCPDYWTLNDNGSCANPKTDAKPATIDKKDIQTNCQKYQWTQKYSNYPWSGISNNSDLCN